jgi:Flp pilus assembly protein TadB
MRRTACSVPPRRRRARALAARGQRRPRRRLPADRRRDVMSSGERSKDSAARGGLATLAVAAFAVLCCALALLAAPAGSVAIGTLLGVGAGLAAAVLLAVAVVVRVRQRQACSPRRSAGRSR